METRRDTFGGSDHALLASGARRYCAQVLATKAMDLDEHPDAAAVEAARRDLCDVLGFGAGLIDEAHGGAGLDAHGFALVVAEIARISPGLAALLASHNLVLWALARSLGSELAIRSGGWSALAFACEAEGELVHAAFVPGGAVADRIVFCVGDRLHCRAASAVTLTEDQTPLGWRAARPASMTARLVDPAAAPATPWRETDHGVLEAWVLLSTAAVAVGILRESLARASDYARGRYQGGRHLIEHDIIRQKLAAMHVAQTNAGALLAAASQTWHGGVLDLCACRAAKIAASAMAVHAATEAVQIHGGYGYMRDVGVERLLRDARCCQGFPRPADDEVWLALGPLGT